MKEREREGGGGQGTEEEADKRSEDPVGNFIKV